jgi:hypothetical protein
MQRFISVSYNPRAVRSRMIVLLVVTALVFANLPQADGAAASVAARVYGQAGKFTTSGINLERISGESLSYVNELATDSAGGLYVADTDNNRALYFPSGTVSATKVFGQATFSSNFANNGGRSATTLSGPEGIAVFNNDVYIADTDNNRVLYYPGGQAAATVVYGQANFTTANTGLGTTGLNQPTDVAATAEGVYVADRNNNRVLFYPSGQVTATRVYGQANFATGTANNGGRSANTLSRPESVAVDSNGNLYIADAGNHRVLFYPKGAEASAQVTATKVYGQGNFTAGGQNRDDNPTNKSLSNPLAIALDGNNGLYVADTFNNRTLYFAADSDPATDQAAEAVYGQPNFTTFDPTGNPITNPDVNTLDLPYGVAATTNGVFIVDYLNNRILYFANDSDPATGKIADAVIGQDGSFTQRGSNFSNLGNRSASGPEGIAFDATTGGAYMADTGNNRVLFYPSASYTATRVIGQAGFLTNAEGTSATALKSPSDVAVDATGGVYVVDRGNNRVLYFANDGNRTADRVYGQPTFATGTANNGGLDADSLSNPNGVAVDATGLYIADTGNNRVLYYSGVLTAATRVYGQPDFTTGTPDTGGRSEDTLRGPQDIALNSTGVYIADTGNNRILFYPGITTTATRVYGQDDFTGNAVGTSATRLRSPKGVATEGTNGIYISDSSNHRALYFVGTSTTATRVYGQINFTGGQPNSIGGVSAASLFNPTRINTDNSNGLYIADTSNNRSLYFGTSETSTTLTSSQNPSALSQPVSFRAVVTSTTGAIPSGSVEFYGDGALLSTRTLDAAGVATYTTSVLPQGSTVISATYIGPAFDPSTSNSINQQVTGCASLIVTVATDNGTVGPCGTLSTAIDYANSAPANGEPITITFASNLTVTVSGALPVISSTTGKRIVVDGGCTAGTAGAASTPGAGIRTTSGVANGLQLGGNVTVNGVRLTGFTSYAVTMAGDANVLTCSWLGTSNGTTATANGGGVRIGTSAEASNNNSLGILGVASSGNLIAGNTGIGVLVENGTGNTGYYNWVGYNRTGGALANGQAVRVLLGAQIRFGMGNRFRF